MNLDHPTQETMAKLLEAIGKQLQIANPLFVDPKHYDLEKYDHLKTIYEYLQKNGKLSTMETNAFIEELKAARKW